MPAMVDFLTKMPEFGEELYFSKKMKTNADTARRDLPIIIDTLEKLPEWTEESVHTALLNLAAKQGVTVLNAPGTVDAGYRGEIKVPLINLDPKHTAVFHPGDRIAQLVIQRYVEARFIPAETLPGSDRAERGFGSTGVAS